MQLKIAAIHRLHRTVQRFRMAQKRMLRVRWDARERLTNFAKTSSRPRLEAFQLDGRRCKVGTKAQQRSSPPIRVMLTRDRKPSRATPQRRVRGACKKVFRD